MKDRFSFRSKFNILAAAATLAFSASFAEAAQPPKRLTAAPKTAMAAAAAPARIMPVKRVFVPFSPTGESCPDPNATSRPKWIIPSFDVSAREQQLYLSNLGFQIGRHRPDGFFNERATQSVNEFRLLSDNQMFRESMTESNFNDLKNFSAQVRRDMQRHNLTEEKATAFRFASNRTGIDIAQLKEPFAPDIATWLYLIDTYGKKYGLGFFTQRIQAVTNAEAVTLSVTDPTTLEQIMALRHHPRISVMMQAEYLKNKADLPSLRVAGTMADAGEHSYLRVLGFDLGDEPSQGVKGPLTEAALVKFDQLFMPASGFFATSGNSLGSYLALFAEQAQKDANTYGISTAAAAAIRLANIRTGADFGYMMELSSAESSFDPEARAATSSATGLYQFTEDTWLHMVNLYGGKYGMNALAEEIQATDNMYGILVARAENPFVRATALELRKDPHLAALMSAEFQMRNKFIVECSVGHALNRTEQYLAHFLGSRGAAHFLNRMAKTPHANAARMFPTAAGANKPIFYARDKKGRLQAKTLRQVYNALDKKFGTGSYEDHSVRATARQPEPARPVMPPVPPPGTGAPPP